MSSFCGLKKSNEPQKACAMDARYTIRKNQLLDECQVAPEIFAQVMPRLHTLMAPFVDTFQGQALSHHAKTSVSGLRSDVARKNVASIASHVGQNRLGRQGFIGWAAWDDAPVRKTVLDHVGTPLGQGDGVLVCDPSALPKSGRASVGVARQWCGRLGKVDHGHVAISLGSVSRTGHTLVALRLSLPKAWTQEKARLQKAGVPQARRSSRTRHQLAWERLEHNGASLPHGWRAGDDEMGRPDWCRRRLAAVGARSLLAVPSHTMLRALETPAPDASGKGRPPKRPWQSVKAWAESLGTAAWRRVDVRDGAKGPLVVDVVKRRVVSRTHRRQQGDEALLVVIRSRDRDQEQVVKVDEYLSNVVPQTQLAELARVAKAAHRIEACMQRSKSEAGLADYEGRHWTGWQQHHTLSFLATWFLVQETERGKKMDPCDDVTPDSPRHRDDLARGVSVRHEGASAGRLPEALATQ
jgi:SRSO17 transposase